MLVTLSATMNRSYLFVVVRAGGELALAIGLHFLYRISTTPSISCTEK